MWLKYSTAEDPLIEVVVHRQPDLRPEIQAEIDCQTVCQRQNIYWSCEWIQEGLPGSAEWTHLVADVLKGHYEGDCLDADGEEETDQPTEKPKVKVCSVEEEESEGHREEIGRRSTRRSGETEVEFADKLQDPESVEGPQVPNVWWPWWIWSEASLGHAGGWAIHNLKQIVWLHWSSSICNGDSNEESHGWGMWD